MIRLEAKCLEVVACPFDGELQVLVRVTRREAALEAQIDQIACNNLPLKAGFLDQLAVNGWSVILGGPPGVWRLGLVQVKVNIVKSAVGGPGVENGERLG